MSGIIGRLHLELPAPVAIGEADTSVALADGRQRRGDARFAEHVGRHPAGQGALAQGLETAHLATGRARQREQGQGHHDQGDEDFEQGESARRFMA